MSEIAMVSSKTGIKYVKFTTFSIALAYVIMGLASGIIGPTLLTLARNVNQDISALAFVVFAKGLGYVIGSFFTQFISRGALLVSSALIIIIYRRFSQYFVMSGALFVIAIGEMCCPLMPNAELLIAAKFVTGLGMGVEENVGLVMLVQLWTEEKSAPFVQLSQLSYGIGSVIAPIIANPFIDSDYDHEHNSTAINESEMNETTNDVIMFPHVAWSYLIISAFSVIVGVMFLYQGVACKTLCAPKAPKNTTKADNTWFRNIFLALLFVFFIFHVGVEVTIGSYLFTFMVLSEYKADSTTGTILNAIWWAFFILGSVVTIFASKRFTPKMILTTDMWGLFISVLLLLCFPLYVYIAPVFLWVGIALQALFIANLYPTGISFTANYVFLDASATAVVTIGAGLGEMLVPLLAGSLIDSSPNAFLWVISGNIFLVIVFYIFMLILAKNKTKFKNRARSVVFDDTFDEEENKNEEIDMKEVRLLNAQKK